MRTQVSLARIAAAAALFFIPVLVYLPSLQGGFLWDDDAFVTENPLIRDPQGWLDFWTTTTAPDYFPLVSTFLWAQWQVWGDWPMGFRTMSLLLHAASTLLAWGVLARLRVPGAYVAALLFGIHPVNVMTVCWITETKNTLPMVFTLVSALLYLRSYDANWRTAPYVTAIVLFVLALLGKTSYVMLPVVLLVLTVYLRGRWRWSDALRTAPFFAASLVLGLVTVFFQYSRSIQNVVIREDDLLSRIQTAAWAVWFYLGKVVFPIGLSFTYPKWIAAEQGLLAWVPLAGLAAAFAGLVLWARRSAAGRGALAGALCYGAMLLPVLGFLNIFFMRYTYVSDHYQYPAILAALAVLVGGVFHYFRLRSPDARWAAPAVGACLCAILSLQTLAHQRHFLNTEVLYRSILARDPKSSFAHANLGAVLRGRGLNDEAERHYEEAIRLDPRSFVALTNLAALRMDQGRTTESLELMREADGIQPDSPGVLRNLGIALLRTGNREAGLAALRRSAELAPLGVRSQFALGDALLQTGDARGAIEPLRTAARLDPQASVAWKRLGDALRASGDADGAAEAYQRVLTIQPRYVDVRVELAEALLDAGRADEAATELARALEIRSGYAPALRLQERLPTAPAAARSPVDTVPRPHEATSPTLDTITPQP